MTQAEIGEEVGLTQRGVGKALEQKSQSCEKSSNQQTRAKVNGISDRTQRKIDRIRKVDPDLADRCERGEVKVEAALRLVLCNTQSELHPLEEGKHAAESPLSIRAYAEAIGKPHSTLSDKIKAWRVLSCTDIRTPEVRDRWSCLAEIHAAPEWLWPALVRPKNEKGPGATTTPEPRYGHQNRVRILPRRFEPWPTAPVQESYFANLYRTPRPF